MALSNMNRGQLQHLSKLHTYSPTGSREYNAKEYIFLYALKLHRTAPGLHSGYSINLHRTGFLQRLRGARGELHGASTVHMTRDLASAQPALVRSRREDTIMYHNHAICALPVCLELYPTTFAPSHRSSEHSESTDGPTTAVRAWRVYHNLVSIILFCIM